MLERPPAWRLDLREILGGFRGAYLVNAIVAFLFAASAPVAVVLAAGQAGNLSEAQIASWLFGCFFVNGIITLICSLTYRQPLVFFWTIPGTVLVGQALDHLSFAEALGAYYATGVLMLVLGLSGWMRRVMDLMPMPIVMAMVAGVFMQFALNLVFALRDGPAIAGPMTLVFLLLTVVPRLGRYLPPMLAALVVGMVMSIVTGGFHFGDAAPQIVAQPQFVAPSFSWSAMIELVVPLAITVLAAQNAQGFVVLEAGGHKPPVNMVTSVCGAGSIVAAAFGTVSTCFTGPVTAILVSGGQRERHYTAAVTVGLLALLFGVFAPLFARFMLATPKVFIAALAGLALLRILERAFVVSFKGDFTFGAIVAFLVTVANVPLLSIGAPFWGLLLGYGASRLLERDAFRTPGR